MFMCGRVCVWTCLSEAMFVCGRVCVRACLCVAVFVCGRVFVRTCLCMDVFVYWTDVCCVVERCLLGGVFSRRLCVTQHPVCVAASPAPLAAPAISPDSMTAYQHCASLGFHKLGSVCVCVCVCERERVMCMDLYICVCVCVCVCRESLCMCV